MKIKPRIYSWSNELRPPLLPPINMIFEREAQYGAIFTNAALLYQDILKYGIEHNNGFKFIELGNWLIHNNNDFRSYYTDSKAHTPKSARLSNRRDTIQKHVDNLINMDLLYKKTIVKAKKNATDTTPLYDLTMDGQFLALIIQAKDPEKSFDLNWTIKNKRSNKMKTPELERANDITKVYDKVDTFTRCKESFVLFFLSKLLKKCMDAGIFGDIIDLFYYFDLQHIELNNGQEILRLFVKLAHPLHWVYAYPELFAKTIDEMDEDAKRVMLFEFKIEIEEYYSRYYLVSYAKRHNYTSYSEMSANYPDILAIRGSEWQRMRVNNMASYKKLVIPGICYNCKAECAFKLNIEDYLKHLVEYASGKIRLSDTISYKCSKCSTKDGIIGHLYIALDMIRGHEKI